MRICLSCKQEKPLTSFKRIGMRHRKLLAGMGEVQPKNARYLRCKECMKDNRQFNKGNPNIRLHAMSTGKCSYD